MFIIKKSKAIIQSKNLNLQQIKSFVITTSKNKNEFKGLDGSIPCLDQR
jgi:hypothetical protein